jgi:hypothetical protein
MSIKPNLSANEANKPGSEGGSPGVFEEAEKAPMESEFAEAEMNKPGGEGGTPG